MQQLLLLYLHCKAECLDRKARRNLTISPPATIAVPLIYFISSLPCFALTLDLTYSDTLPRRPMLPLHTQQHHGYG